MAFLLVGLECCSAIVIECEHEEVTYSIDLVQLKFVIHTRKYSLDLHSNLLAGARIFFASVKQVKWHSNVR